MLFAGWRWPTPAFDRMKKEEAPVNTVQHCTVTTVSRGPSRLELARMVFDLRHEAALAALEKPSHPYRVRRDRERGCFVVERWAVRHDDAGDALSHYLINVGIAWGDSVDREVEALLDKSPKPRIIWHRLSDQTFTTLKAALGWLREFIAPADDVVHLDEKGSIQVGDPE